jgi:hypothetical protein
MLSLFVFKTSESADWIKNLSEKITPQFFKNVINSIVSLATVVITYVVIMVIIAKFFEGPGGDGTELARQIMDGSLFAGDLSDDNLAMITFGGCLVLVYVVQYLAGNIQQVSKMITDAFGVEDRHKIGDNLGEDAIKLGKGAFAFAASTGKTLLGAASGKKPEKKEEKNGSADSGAGG